LSSRAGAGTAASAAEVFEELLARRRWLLRELKNFEERYGMPTGEFVEAWRRGEIPEPEDPDLLAEFMSWETLYEALRRLEERIEREAQAVWRRRFSGE